MHIGTQSMISTLFLILNKFMHRLKEFLQLEHTPATPRHTAIQLIKIERD